MITRRDFVKTAALAASAGAFAAGPVKKTDEIRALLLHLGRNMWGWAAPEGMKVEEKGFLPVATTLECREDLWRAATDRAAQKGDRKSVV